MITIKNGKLFCEEYNKRNGTEFSPKEIFCNIIAPLCFNSLKQCLSINNSKFDLKFIFANAKKEWGKDEDVMKKNGWTYHQMIEEKKKRLSEKFPSLLEEFCKELEDDSKTRLMTSLKVYGGCADNSNGKLNTTSFCGCDNVFFTIDERYCSFIGIILSMQYKGFAIPTNNRESVWKCYESLQSYRRMLDTNECLDGNQINTWNLLYLLKSGSETPEQILYANSERSSKGNSVTETITLSTKHITFIDIISLFIRNGKNFIELENFGQQNTTSGAIEILGIESTRRTIGLINQILKELGYEYNKEEAYKLVLKENLFNEVLKKGFIASNMFDMSIKDEYFKNKKPKELHTNFIKKYITAIMSDELKELCAETVALIKSTNPKKSKGRTAFDNVLSANNGSSFSDNLDALVASFGTKDDNSKRICHEILELSKNDFSNFKTYINIELR